MKTRSDATTEVVPGAACIAHSYMDKTLAAPRGLIIRCMWCIYPALCSKPNFAQTFQ